MIFSGGLRTVKDQRGKVKVGGAPTPLSMNSWMPLDVLACLRASFNSWPGALQRHAGLMLLLLLLLLLLLFLLLLLLLLLLLFLFHLIPSEDYT